MKNLSHFPKTDIRFWQTPVFRQPYVIDRQRRLTKEWYARVQFQGKHRFFPLGTPNKAAYAAKARDIYFFLILAQIYRCEPMIPSCSLCRPSPEDIPPVYCIF
jgi:hypothetical protein